MATENKPLCGVCAALMTEAGIQLRKVPGRTQKVTCANCGKRRFGGVFEIDTSSGAARGADNA